MSNRKKTFVHICEEFEYTWIGKDNGMFPIYAHEVLGYESKIVTSNLKDDLPDEVRGVKIVKVSRWFKKVKNFLPFIIHLKRIPLYYYISKNAKNIDILMLFHITKCSYWRAYFYKKFNPIGKIYIKADFNLEQYRKEIERTEMSPRTLREYLRKNREIKEYSKRKRLVEMADLISYETEEAYEEMKNSYAGISTKGKVLHIPNGYDSKYIDSLFKDREFKNKENLMITVGRLGTYQKNTELLLESLAEIDLKDWKMIFIGGIEKELEPKIEKFYEQYPEKKESVVFKGVIKDKNELYSYYNKAKVFLLSSRWEGFALVFLEALAFGNYIVSTDVGGARDVTENAKIGEIIPGDKESFKKAIQDCVNNKIEFEEKYSETIEKSSEFNMTNLIKKINGFV
ncbi:glycosyltransferase [Cetobacterium sp. ZOR0034]|uniref:glycosyltransferase n=1 Tax=Cetobacterium sp. ZOR0034 TaxID=1339239 RepID=UPI000645B46A|nr:glycosyltransferase [Cetobacterium sp. ZOR0034]